MALRPAWAAEGSRIPASVMRNLAWNATNGASGVTKPLDLKVSALAVPGPAVNIRTGGWTVESTYAKAAGAPESYTGGNDATVQLPIPASGASDLNWAVILRIDDPEMNNGTKPDNPLTYTYCKFDVVFGANLASVTDPYILLATVRVPANTATVTNDMITDRRKVANPRRDPHQITNALVVSEAETLTNTTQAGERFPNAGGLQRLDVPSWATRVSIDVRWSSLLLDSAASTGRFWVEWGDDIGGGHFAEKTQEFSYAGENSGYKHRVGAEVGDYRTIPAKYRGQSDVAFAAMGRKVTGVGPTMDALTGMVWQIVFEEVADASYT